MVNPLSMRDIENKLLTWIWKPYVARGKVTLIQGKTGIGKTSIVLKVVADLSNGFYPPTMLHGHLLPQVQSEPIITYYVTTENGLADTLGPLFDIYAGNRDNLIVQDEKAGHFVLTSQDIRDCVEQTGAQLIVVDPWQQFLNKLSSRDNEAVREMICEIQNVAEELDVAIILAGNFTKSLRSELTGGLGGSELSNTLRSILTVKESPDKEAATRILEVTKMSLLGKEMTPVVFRQDDKGNLSYGTFDDVIEPTPQDDAVAFLHQILKNGALSSKEVMSLGAQKGFGKQRLYAARRKAGDIRIVELSDKSTVWMIKGKSEIEIE